MRWTQRFFAVGLALALSAMVSCTTGDDPTGLPMSPTSEPPSQSFGSLVDGLGGIVDGVTDAAGGAVGGILGITDLLTCNEQRYEVTRETIGRNGGRIEVGKHVLEIPRGALSRNVRITAEQMPGRTNSVRFSPDLEFARSAKLTMSYKNCLLVLLPKKIVYTDEGLNVLDVLRSLDLFNKRTVSAPIDHFSRYAVAY